MYITWFWFVFWIEHKTVSSCEAYYHNSSFQPLCCQQIHQVLVCSSCFATVCSSSLLLSVCCHVGVISLSLSCYCHVGVMSLSCYCYILPALLSCTVRSSIYMYLFEEFHYLTRFLLLLGNFFYRLWFWRKGNVLFFNF